jgi:hypothetical protein
MATLTPKPALGSTFAKQIQGKTLSVSVHSKIRAKDVHDALEQIFRLSGCTDCGLNGYDVHLHAINPAISDALQSFKQMPGIQSIQVEDMLR